MVLESLAKFRIPNTSISIDATQDDIGAGGYGTVKLGHIELTKDQVAVKILRMTTGARSRKASMTNVRHRQGRDLV